MTVVLQNCSQCTSLWDIESLTDDNVCPHCSGSNKEIYQSDTIASLISQELGKIHQTNESYEMLITRMDLLQDFIRITLGKEYHLIESESDEYGFEISQRIPVEEGGIIYARFVISSSFAGAKVSYRGSSRPLSIKSDEVTKICEYHKMILCEKLRSKFYHQEG